jgi:hypothetical protein
MGVVLQDVTPPLAEAMNLGQTRGALIGDVGQDGLLPARSGPGDLMFKRRKPVPDVARFSFSSHR